LQRYLLTGGVPLTGGVGLLAGAVLAGGVEPASGVIVTAPLGAVSGADEAGAAGCCVSWSSRLFEGALLRVPT
jgi:hypothetical protein